MMNFHSFFVCLPEGTMSSPRLLPSSRAAAVNCRPRGSAAHHNPWPLGGLAAEMAWLYMGSGMLDPHFCRFKWNILQFLGYTNPQIHIIASRFDKIWGNKHSIVATWQRNQQGYKVGLSKKTIHYQDGVSRFPTASITGNLNRPKTFFQCSPPWHIMLT